MLRHFRVSSCLCLRFQVSKHSGLDSFTILLSVTIGLWALIWGCKAEDSGGFEASGLILAVSLSCSFVGSQGLEVRETILNRNPKPGTPQLYTPTKDKEIESLGCWASDSLVLLRVCKLRQGGV